MAFYPCRKAALVDAIEQSAGAAAPIVTFNSQINGIPLAEFIANITPIQAGSGDPSPSNPRPITGWSAVHAYRSGADTTNPDTYTINLNGTFYLATLNVLTGLLTVLGKYLVFNSAEYYGTYGEDDAPLFYVDITGEGIARIQNAGYDKFLISNMFSKISTSSTQTMKNYEIRTDATPTRFYFRMNEYTSKTDIDAFLADNPLQVVAELVTPVTYQLTPAQITQILGENNVFADSGDSSIKYYKLQRR